MTVTELREHFEELEKEEKGDYEVRSYDDCE